MSVQKINLFSFSGNIRILHLSWFAFFLTFVMWFSYAPLLASIRETLQLTDQQVKALLILNVALAIPARIVVGMLVDAFGPRRMFSMLLVISSFLCFGFAFAEDYEQLALMRFLMGFAGAGFVIGIRMISEWFPAKQLGLAEGIYGGWGNFGSAAAAISLPTIALLYGGDDGWRYAIASTGVVAAVFAVVWFFSVSDTPKGSTYFKPKKSGAMEISSPGDFFLYLVILIPLFAALAVLAWKLGPDNLAMLNANTLYLIYGSLLAIYIFQVIRIYQINKHVFSAPVPEIERYEFKQVAVLNLAYMVTFGSELAVVSMLPLFFMDSFGLSAISAGLVASIFAGLNLVMRPAGGLISDKYGRKLSLIVILIGLAAGFAIMSFMNSSWPLLGVIAVTIFCSLFVNAGNGAVFAVVPLVKRRLTGQIAGMAGAYGNVGAVAFLTIFSFVPTQSFFLVIAGASVFSLLAVTIFMKEPRGQMAEVMADGTVQMIDVH